MRELQEAENRRIAKEEDDAREAARLAAEEKEQQEYRARMKKLDEDRAREKAEREAEETAKKEKEDADRQQAEKELKGDNNDNKGKDQLDKQQQNGKNKLNGKRQTEFKGKKVTQDDDLFDPYAVDREGRTNIERMKQGRSPIGRDGKPVNVHHVDQTNTGPVTEMSGSEHQQGFGDLHQNTGQSPSQINRSQFNTWRKSYWKWRVNDFK